MCFSLSIHLSPGSHGQVVCDWEEQLHTFLQRIVVLSPSEDQCVQEVEMLSQCATEVTVLKFANDAEEVFVVRHLVPLALMGYELCLSRPAVAAYCLQVCVALSLSSVHAVNTLREVVVSSVLHALTVHREHPLVVERALSLIHVLLRGYADGAVQWCVALPGIQGVMHRFCSDDSSHAPCLNIARLCVGNLANMSSCAESAWKAESLLPSALVASRLFSADNTLMSASCTLARNMLRATGVLGGSIELKASVPALERLETAMGPWIPMVLLVINDAKRGLGVSTDINILEFVLLYLNIQIKIRGACTCPAASIGRGVVVAFLKQLAGTPGASDVQCVQVFEVGFAVLSLLFSGENTRPDVVSALRPFLSTLVVSLEKFTAQSAAMTQNGLGVLAILAVEVEGEPDPANTKEAARMAMLHGLSMKALLAHMHNKTAAMLVGKALICLTVAAGVPAARDVMADVLPTLIDVTKAAPTVDNIVLVLRVLGRLLNGGHAANCETATKCGVYPFLVACLECPTLAELSVGCIACLFLLPDSIWPWWLRWLVLKPNLPLLHDFFKDSASAAAMYSTLCLIHSAAEASQSARQDLREKGFVEVLKRVMVRACASPHQHADMLRVFNVAKWTLEYFGEDVFVSRTVALL